MRFIKHTSALGPQMDLKEFWGSTNVVYLKPAALSTQLHL